MQSLWKTNRHFYPVAFKAIVIFMTMALFLPEAKATGALNPSDEEIADAIYLAEGGARAKAPFGILSVKCEGYDDCRKICLNTIRNNRKRYAEYGYKQYKTFLEFLWHRYAPPEIHPLNRFWLKNVVYFLERNKKNGNEKKKIGRHCQVNKGGSNVCRF